MNVVKPEKYEYTETPLGVWRGYRYPNGQVFREFRSHAQVLGLPLMHYTRGKCPETGRLVVARGIVAVGRLAIGVVAIGQASCGIIGIGQASLGLLLGVGQATAAFTAFGQLAVGIVVGIGQFATGAFALGQFAWGHYVIAQFGCGTHVWAQFANPGCKEFLKNVLP